MKFQKLLLQSTSNYVDPPLGGGRHCFAAVCVSVSPITKGFLGGMFLFLRSLPFDFCYDLDNWAQSKALRAFFICNLFFHYLIKSMRGILIKHDRKVHRHLAHDPIIVDL